MHVTIYKYVYKCRKCRLVGGWFGLGFRVLRTRMPAIPHSLSLIGNLILNLNPKPNPHPAIPYSLSNNEILTLSLP